MRVFLFHHIHYYLYVCDIIQCVGWLCKVCVCVCVYCSMFISISVVCVIFIHRSLLLVTKRYYYLSKEVKMYWYVLEYTKFEVLLFMTVWQIGVIATLWPQLLTRPLFTVMFANSVYWLTRYLLISFMDICTSWGCAFPRLPEKYSWNELWILGMSYELRILVACSPPGAQVAAKNMCKLIFVHYCIHYSYRVTHEVYSVLKKEQKYNTA